MIFVPVPHADTTRVGSSGFPNTTPATGIENGVLEALEAGFDAVVVTGCVVRGETRHDRHIVDAAFGQFSALAVRFRRPVALAVLTVEDLKQARARAGGDKGDAGAFAMRAALRTLDTMRLVREEAKR